MVDGKADPQPIGAAHVGVQKADRLAEHIIGHCLDGLTRLIGLPLRRGIVSALIEGSGVEFFDHVEREPLDGDHLDGRLASPDLFRCNTGQLLPKALKTPRLLTGGFRVFARLRPLKWPCGTPPVNVNYSPAVNSELLSINVQRVWNALTCPSAILSVRGY